MILCTLKGRIAPHLVRRIQPFYVTIGGDKKSSLFKPRTLVRKKWGKDHHFCAENWSSSVFLRGETISRLFM